MRAPRNLLASARHRVLATAAGALVVAVLLAACGATAVTSPSVSAPPSAAAGAIVREDLGSTLPATASGQRLGLWHYTIPAGSKLVPHHHPGWQVARITAGTLTYTIIKGAATVIRAGGATETHSNGETITLAAGDTVVENPDLEHFGANQGSVAVEIYTSSLFTDGEPPAIPLPSASPSPAG